MREGKIEDDYYAVDFGHIDDYRCLRPLSEAVSESDYDQLRHYSDHAPVRGATYYCDCKEKALRLALTEFFSRAGWEGDGEINCIFLPPCFSGRDDGKCEVIYHVKQGNNGISCWLFQNLCT